MKGNRFILGIIISLFVFSLIGILIIPHMFAAPSGQVFFPEGEVSSEDMVLELGASGENIVKFENTASDITDVASTIQFITLSAANLNPSRALIALDASWKIYEPGETIPRTSGAITGSLDENAIYAPYSTTETIFLYTWALGKPADDLDVYTSSGQFRDDLKILRPGEVIELTITVECQNVVGDSRIWFFFVATEFQPTSLPITDINAIPVGERMNLYYSKSPGPDQTPYWWPLHNSYDPYDPDIDTGHAFQQVSWTIKDTTNVFAKADKLVHQKPVENPEFVCIDIIKNGPATAQAGDTIIYEFTVANCGNVDLSAVTVTDPLLGGVIWGIDNLAVGQSANFNVDYTIPPDHPPYDPLENTATASGHHGDVEVNDSDSHSVNVDPGDLCIDIIKEGRAAARVGDTITYEFTVTNCGSVNLSNVTVTDTLLGGEIWSTDTLVVGAPITFQVDYTIPDPPPSDPLDNTATASGHHGVTDVSDSDSHPINIDKSTFSFHICGIKFDDLNRDGKYDPAIDPTINGVTVTLLGLDETTPAEIYYAGKFTYPPPETNPLESGENMLRGSYCFNLQNVSPGTYTFYVEETVPPGRVATTPTLIGPLTLVACCDGPRESVNNHFGNAEPEPEPILVGGEVHSLNRLALLAPWLGLVASLIAGTTLVIKRRRTRS